MAAPKASGEKEEKLVTGLLPRTTYFFVLKVSDDAGNSAPYAQAFDTTGIIAITSGMPVEGVTYNINSMTASISTDIDVTACNLTLNAGSTQAMTGAGKTWNLALTGLPEGGNSIEFVCAADGLPNGKVVSFNVLTLPITCDEAKRPANVTSKCENGVTSTEFGICDTETGEWKIQQTIEACQVIDLMPVAAIIIVIAAAGIGVVLWKKGMFKNIKLGGPKPAPPLPAAK
jgi:hypothetical protein